MDIDIIYIYEKVWNEDIYDEN